MSIQDDYFSKSVRYRKTIKERAILVGVSLSNMSEEDTRESIEELAFLADTAGAVVLDTIIQPRKLLDPAYYIGKGKVQEIKELSEKIDANLIIFDDDLKPRQVKNLEDALGIKTIDRTELILDIFAFRARTKEAMIQVELAQLEYTLPRLKRMWTHFSKIEGGIGMRGPGETQLEADKRLIKKKISNLKKALNTIEARRYNRIKGRENIFKVSLIGYTNAGKSTILNALTGSDVFCENRLFATLDTTTRRLYLKEGVYALLSDTVGFIRKLPSHLVASFRSTLDELKLADLLLHVIDVSHSNFEAHILSVSETLKELNLEEKPVIYLFNKIDSIDSDGLLNNLEARYPGSVFISALKGYGLNDLKVKILEQANLNL